MADLYAKLILARPTMLQMVVVLLVFLALTSPVARLAARRGKRRVREAVEHVEASVTRAIARVSG